MRASTKILGKIERVLSSPGWTYCAMWHFPPYVPRSFVASKRPAPDRREHEESR